MNLLFERRGFHLLVILTKLVTGQAREPLLSTPERSRIIYCLYGSVYTKLKIHATLSNRKLGITITVDDHSLSQQTALHIAAREGHERTVEYLVSKGADINIQDNNGVCMTILLMIH